MEVVYDYTRRTASDESDKLVACAAVAEQFHLLLGSEYLAGLWRSDTTLLTQLLWRVFVGESSTQREARASARKRVWPGANA